MVSSIYEAPATRIVAVSPNNSTDIQPTRALWVGGAGALAVIAADDQSSVTIAAVPAGTLLPISVTRVLATGTVASAILALS